CAPYIKALNECHNSSFFVKMLGLCNDPKEALNKCLHKTRVDQSVEKLNERKLKHKKVEERWRQMEEEEYGENLRLKKIIDIQLQKMKEQEK
ncbi:Cmc2p ASCRUDRAFT_27578, partial [Ascoidea rubescens DSM 1968]